MVSTNTGASWKRACRLLGRCDDESEAIVTFPLTRPWPTLAAMQHSLALALDPSLVLKTTGMEPDPWQHGGPAVVLASATAPQLRPPGGQEPTVAALALHTALFQPKSLTLLLSPTLRQSLELFRKIGDLCGI